MLSFAIVLRRFVNFSQPNLAEAFRRIGTNPCSVNDEYGNNGRGADEFRGSAVSQNRVKAAVAFFHHVAALFVSGNQAKTVTEIPASRPLAEISAEGCHVSDLRA